MIDKTTPSYGLTAWFGEPQRMELAHCHNDVELNLIERGTVTYSFGGEIVSLAAGDVCVFWAARPHRLSCDTVLPVMHWLTIPLALFLSWNLPDQLSTPILQGQALRRRDEDERTLDELIFRRWHRDLNHGAAEWQALACLEIQAFLQRFALTVEPGQHEGSRGQPNSHADAMARFIVARYAEPLSIAAIAASVGLHPHYAMQLFRQTYGMSLLAYLTQYRVAYAQQLLATSDESVLAIGLAAGFGSASRFHSAFKATIGVSPAAYRASLR
jgi:AraC-like DNA-binding protein